MNNRRPFSVGTRGSALALWQANWTRERLQSASGDVVVDIVPIKTTGDRVLDAPLAEIGGKGLFTKELDQALLDGRIDLAVHSMKDLPFEVAPGTVIGAITEREDPRDAVVSPVGTLDEMPPGSRIGTGSLRRAAQLRQRFPHLEPSPVRGNVGTRLRKLDDGEFEAVLLAAAGLRRLGYGARITQHLETDIMLPAIGQGALAIVCRADDPETLALVASLNHWDTRIAVEAERGLLASLHGDCRIPIAGHATVEQDAIVLHGLISSVDGQRVLRDSVRGGTEDPSALGFGLGTRLLGAGGDALLRESRAHDA